MHCQSIAAMCTFSLTLNLITLYYFQEECNVPIREPIICILPMNSCHVYLFTDSKLITLYTTCKKNAIFPLDSQSLPMNSCHVYLFTDSKLITYYLHEESKFSHQGANESSCLYCGHLTIIKKNSTIITGMQGFRLLLDSMLTCLGLPPGGGT